MDRLTKEQGLKLLHEYGTPDHVIRHCQAVTDAALAVAGELNRCGKNFDLEVIEGAGIIHDIARVEDEHWKKGAEYARSLGLDDEAAIIEQHMHHRFNDFEEFDETDIVCLADRTVMEDQYVGLERRIVYLMDKARRNGLPEEDVLGIRTRMEKNQTYIDSIEQLTGKSLSEICSEVGNYE